MTDVRQGGVIAVAPSQEDLVLAGKIAGEATQNVTGINGNMPLARKPELLEFVRAQVEELGLSKKQVEAVMESTIKGLIAFPGAGAKLTIVGFGSVAPIARAARQTSLFGEPHTVEQTQYFSFDPGNVSKEVALNAPNAIPTGKLRKSGEQETRVEKISL